MAEKQTTKETKETRATQGIETEEIGEADLEIKRLMKEVSETNRKIEDAYEEKLRRLEAKKKLTPNEEEAESSQERISRLSEKLRELKARISEARKEGKDPLIADLMLRNVNAKIKMAEVTHEHQDYEEVEKVLKRAESELEEALKEEELDVKKEVEARLRRDTAKDTGKAVDE